MTRDEWTARFKTLEYYVTLAHVRGQTVQAEMEIGYGLRKRLDQHPHSKLAQRAVERSDARLEAKQRQHREAELAAREIRDSMLERIAWLEERAAGNADSARR